jgi:hypothetical protein
MIASIVLALLLAVHQNALEARRAPGAEQTVSCPVAEAAEAAMWPELPAPEMREVAGIVAGEAANIDECRLVTACTILRDVEAGLAVDELRPGRWYGWREPGPEHYSAVEEALATGCEGVPRCAFLGSEADLALWRERGWAGEGPYPSWTDRWGYTSVCVTRDR